ncbi:MAG: acyl-CoA dehydrogenase family protein, partial [Dehalococcoidia bacterium]
WYTLGLRGTGSKDMLVDDVFVPTHRSISTGALFSGRSEPATCHSSKIYLAPVLPGLALHIGAGSLGIARGALNLFVEQTKGRAHAYTGQSKADVVGLQMRIAEAAAEIRSAELLLSDLCVQFEQQITSGERPDVPMRARTKWQAAYVTQLCRRAVERLYAAAGARSVYNSSGMQKAFRDINTATHHATLDPDDAAETYGRLQLGLSAGTYIL